MPGKKVESHKPHGKLGNPNPIQPPEFLAAQRQAFGDYDEPMGKKVFGTRYPQSVEKQLLEIPQAERVELIRKAVIQALAERNDEQ
ncbi:MAG: hypothetical protein AAFO04_27675 [Cyanobacteria bacterium J06592_8]